MFDSSKLLVLTFLAFVLSSCTNVGGFVVPGQALKLDAQYTLIRDSSDERALYKDIKKALEERGLSVVVQSNEPDSPISGVLVRYQAQWQWDMAWFLYDLSIRFYDGADGLLIASAQSNRPSLVRKSSDKMIREALNGVLPSNKKDAL